MKHQHTNTVEAIKLQPRVSVEGKCGLSLPVRLVTKALRARHHAFQVRVFLVDRSRKKGFVRLPL